MFAPDLPTLCVGLRGMIYTEIEARGARTDLHSGMYGGAAPNPFVALAQIIAKLKDANGASSSPASTTRSQTPQQTNSPPGRPALRRRALPRDRSRLHRTHRRDRLLRARAHLGAPHARRPRHARRLHRRRRQDRHPRQGRAKVSMRLVPDMTPAETFALYKILCRVALPRGHHVEVRLIHSGDPIVVSTDNPYVRAATAAMHTVFGKDTVFIRSGGSIPIVGDFVRELGNPTVLMGFGLPDDNLHAPNEKFHLANFHRGIESIIGFWERLGAA
jgi:acetylornithine deacetylase/succinyl-diaminopimelate desuccinylase-like protein